MSSIMVSSNLPLPFIGATDYRLLSRLAYQALSRDFDIAAELIEKLERPCVLPDDQVPPDVVKIGSIVTCEVEDGPCRTFSLVYPDDVDARREGFPSSRRSEWRSWVFGPDRRSSGSLEMGRETI